MNGLKACVELLDNATPVAPALDAAEQMKRGVMALLEHARQEGELACTYPWELAPSVRRVLSREHEWTPPGGWRALSAMMASGGFLVAQSGRYVPAPTSDHVADMQPESLRRQLLQAFTTWLAPPAPTAHLFVALNIHPLWGLKLVSAIDSPHHKGIPTVVSTQIMPDRVLDPARKLVFGTIAIIVATLRKLDPELGYELDALFQLSSEAAGAMLNLVNAPSVEPASGELRLFVGQREDDVFRNVQLQTWRELFDDVFVASGALRIADNGRFQVAPGAFDGVMVDVWEEDVQDRWLSHMTGTEARFLCAS